MAFISVADAVERTGKGSTTIYRLCRKHEHTQHILREDNKFLIDEDFLSKHYDSPADEKIKVGQEPDESRRELIDVFIEELLNEKNYYRQLLDRKDEQLERKDLIIVRLQERQKELHHLLNQQSDLLDQFRKQEPLHLHWQAQQEGKEEEGVEAEKEETSIFYETKTVYTILGAVITALLLAILFVDEIRTLVE